MTSSQEIYEQSCQLIPGGVSSPFRAFSQVGGQPPVLVRGKGAHVWDADGNRYLDFCCAWGPLMLGHAHSALARAGHEAIDGGSIFGAPTPWELDLARSIQAAYPSMEQLRLVNSGAEAVASALRVARGCTLRPRILKFEGCYHGHVECLDSVGLEADELGGPLALGSSPGSCAETLIARFNDLASVQELLGQHRGEVAGIVLEVITGSMGVIEAEAEFLAGLQHLAREHDTLLIFDEVLTGCRVARGGAQERFAISPDLTCLGKALGGGAAIGAYGGRRDLMARVAPLGPIYQAGTFCGNPITTRIATANLKELAQPGLYAELAVNTAYLIEGLRALGPEVIAQGVPGMFSLGFGRGPLRDHRDMAGLDTERFARVYHRLLARGLYLPPSTFDAACIGAAHTRADLDCLIEAVRQALAEEPLS